MSDQASATTSPRAKGGLYVPILSGIVLALVAANVVLFVGLDNLKRETAGIRESVRTEIASLRQAHTLTTASSLKNLDELREELENTRRQAQVAAGAARKEALKHADQLARQIQDEQVKQQAQMISQLSEVKDAANTVNTRLTDVSTDVSSVKTDVASTRSELDKTVSELRSVRGDLGVQSGLVATNARELAALRALGERNYYEFRITKSKQFQKVGNIQVQLKKSDANRNRYTLALVADDKTVEKKDKGLNEPVQFYVAGTRQPYEIVVNLVGKDVISGYLATPKLMQARGN